MPHSADEAAGCAGSDLVGANNHDISSGDMDDSGADLWPEIVGTFDQAYKVVDDTSDSFLFCNSASDDDSRCDAEGESTKESQREQECDTDVEVPPEGREAVLIEEISRQIFGQVHDVFAPVADGTSRCARSHGGRACAALATSLPAERRCSIRTAAFWARPTTCAPARACLASTPCDQPAVSGEPQADLAQLEAQLALLEASDETPTGADRDRPRHLLVDIHRAGAAEMRMARHRGPPALCLSLAYRARLQRSREVWRRCVREAPLLRATLPESRGPLH